MSISLDSWESITHIVGARFIRSAPPYYKQDFHLPILVNLIGEILGEQYLKIVQTAVILPEPIMRHDKYIIFCMPLIIDYLNAPIEFQTKIEEVVDFDIFQNLNDTVKTNNTNSFSCSTVSAYELTSQNKSALLILFRIVILIQHWFTHELNGSYTHIKFRGIEFARVT